MDMVYVEVVVGVFATFFVIGIVVGVLLVCALRVFGGGRWSGRRG
jgi:hypothetical protein